MTMGLVGKVLKQKHCTQFSFLLNLQPRMKVRPLKLVSYSRFSSCLDALALDDDKGNLNWSEPVQLRCVYQLTKFESNQYVIVQMQGKVKGF